MVRTNALTKVIIFFCIFISSAFIVIGCFETGEINTTEPTDLATVTGSTPSAMIASPTPTITPTPTPTITPTPTPTITPTPSFDISMDNQTGNRYNGNYVAKYKDEIYYANQDDNYKLYKMQSDGSNKVKLSDKANSSFFIGIEFDQEQLFYMNIQGDSMDEHICTLYAFNLTKKTEKKLTNDNIYFYTVYNGWIYYTTVDTYTLYKIRTDGSERTMLSEFSDGPLFLQIKDDKLYLSFDEALYTMNFNGETIGKAQQYHHFQLMLYGDTVYYNDWDLEMCKCPIGMNNDIVVIPQDILMFNIYNNTLYYVTMDDSMIYASNLDGSNSRFIAYGMSPLILDDVIYYRDAKNRIQSLPLLTNNK